MNSLEIGEKVQIILFVSNFVFLYDSQSYLQRYRDVFSFGYVDNIWVINIRQNIRIFDCILSRAKV